MSRHHKNNPPQGFILLSVVLTLTLLATVAFMLSRQGSMNSNTVLGEQHSNIARYTAEAGLNHMLWQTNQSNCTGYTGLSDISIGSHKYTTSITPTSGSPVSINVLGAHTEGANYTIARDQVKIYQFPTQQLVLQPDADNATDTYLYEWKASWNYGLSNTLWVRNNWANSLAYSLINFDLSSIPSGVKIIHAKLELWQNTPSANGGTVGVHKITNDWIEGTKTGGTGSTSWNEKDSGIAWTNPGGDYFSTTEASSIIPAATLGWFQWDITALVSAWVNKTTTNQGLILTPESVNTYVEFNASDSSDPALRPKLTLSYACECGEDCSIISSKNKLLLVVVNPSSLTVQEAAKKTLFESWAYTVTTIDVDKAQSSFDTAVAINDVVYITEDINSNSLGTKLTNTTIGVVTEEDNLSDEFGLSSTITWDSGNSLSVNDNNHYITQLFSLGTISIISATNSLAYVSGTVSTDLKNLASINTSPALVTLDSGASTFTAGTSAGRRVQVPWGGNTFDVNTLTSDGLTILQRSLQWASGLGADNSATATTVEVTVASGDDDAEERKSDGSMGLTSTDLELVFDGTNDQSVGIRFAGLTIPPGASISKAYIQFQTDETNSGSTNVTIKIEDTDSAITFSPSNKISTRTTATPSVAWAPEAWDTVGERGVNQRTPDISPLIQAVIDRPGWANGNAIAIIITGSGERTAESYNGDASAAAMLHIEY